MVTDDSILGVKVAFFCTPLVTNVAKVIVAIVVFPDLLLPFLEHAVPPDTG